MYKREKVDELIIANKEKTKRTDELMELNLLFDLLKEKPGFDFSGNRSEMLERRVDTGVGISQKHMEVIFERFRQANESYDRLYEGSGLGLSIAKSYIEMLGGKIWVESEERKGSIFYFTIPYNAVSKEITIIKDAVPAELEVVKIKKMKILVAEDDKTSFSLFNIILKKSSIEIIHARTGVDAIVSCRNNPDLDLVLMDIKMPDMDGYEATRQIRLFNNDVVIIAQTAYAEPNDREKAKEAGCNDFISKPINKSLLNELIKKHCNK